MHWIILDGEIVALCGLMRGEGGLGIKEVQIIQWFVQPGARVEQFDKLCEVASDKAITEVCFALLALCALRLCGL